MSLTQTTVKIRSGTASRIVWIDIARGIGILLVVVGHTLRGLVSARIVDSSSTTQFVDRLIYSFHMPLFFVLAALFVNRQAKSPRAILTAKVRTLVYPYFVWSILSVLLQHAAGSLANHPAGLASLVKLAYVPVLQYWFLYVLFVCWCLYLPLARMLRPSGIFVAAIALYGWPLIGPMPSWSVATLVTAYFIYFALGVLIAPRLVAAREQGRWQIYMLGATLLFLIHAASIAWLNHAPGRVLGLLLGILGSMASIALASSMQAGRVGVILAWVGRQSLPIYVAHTIVSAATRALLIRIDAAPALHLMLGCLLGVILPLALQYACARLGIKYVFSWPTTKQSTVASDPAPGFTPKA